MFCILTLIFTRATLASASIVRI